MNRMSLLSEKIDQCADFQCLMDALSPVDKLFRGSQNSVDLALRNGKFVGARCLRLHLRDVVYASAQTVREDHGVEIVVPLRVLLAREFGGPAYNPFSFTALGKRRRSRSYTRRAKRCCRKHSMWKHLDRTGASNRAPRLNAAFTRGRMVGPDDLVAAQANVATNSNLRQLSDTADQPATLPVFPSSVNNGQDEDAEQPGHSYPRISSRSRHGRRIWTAFTQSADPLRDCLVSCELDRYRATVDKGRFKIFQDAVHMANLLDPLSKFSVTPLPDGEAAEPPSTKRPRLSIADDSHVFPYKPPNSNV
ncbi:unnamed protein product [Calicophoron daubneyi]|uniref:Uncharacterized protein n=1 Tax=Calicophoron daubneyi TaxID=300641 RepID=A0AAV2TDL7_CALDB